MVREGNARRREPVRGALIHYHEIALKGKNRGFFLKQLEANLLAATRDLDCGPLRRPAGRLFLEMGEGTLWEDLRPRLSRVFGIANFSPAFVMAPDLELLAKRIEEEVSGRSFRSFRVAARRAFKTFPQTSQQINEMIGARVQRICSARVDLTNPDLTVAIEVLPNEAFVYFEKLHGPGGLPVGTGGTLACLLSGGIDSPVAAHRMMKRGCRIVFVHFHSQPFADRTSQDKAIELVRVLTQYQFTSRLYLVPFGEIQQEVVARVTGRLRVLMYRRLMLRIAEQIAHKEGAQALVTGESLGQVSSQTIENIAAIEQASTLPILRPLIGMDKDEITQQAQQVGSYEISIIPDQDCCSMFTPRQAATHTTHREIELAERPLDLDRLTAQGQAAAHSLELSFPG
ncbi:thiamine biosynthesis protein thiI [Candidatus Methylomirabilis lanthanidiphila]|uniref:Probable tRNA sulfurtransferase n=1 Tax=Candidatus Methylomirabilis lanthanidiphila TaxID=2211376 RepID=A0A564ZKT1_9BACT|nr:tRNA 4-thiouridine(8) synthase ThiI [Candidatus Methylomirabilis lanthanidiphila]VUZ85783.1 thiamine biosynthesis protein thiI [Candidatus Methylomirabilis lanthanidiphila]